MFYIVHLNSKNSSDYDGIETYIAEKYEVFDQSWLPNGIALCLNESGEAAGEGDETQAIVNEVYTRVKGCLKVI